MVRLVVAAAPDAGAGVGERSGACAGHAVFRRGGRKERRLRLADQGARLFISRGRRRNRLVGDFDLRQQRVDATIPVDQPPIAAIDVVARPGGFPALELLVLGRYRGRFAGIFGSDGTAGERQGNDQANDRGNNQC